MLAASTIAFTVAMAAFISGASLTTALVLLATLAYVPTLFDGAQTRRGGGLDPRKLGVASQVETTATPRTATGTAGATRD